MLFLSTNSKSAAHMTSVRKIVIVILGKVIVAAYCKTLGIYSPNKPGLSRLVQYIKVKSEFLLFFYPLQSFFLRVKPGFQLRSVYIQ